MSLETTAENYVTLQEARTDLGIDDDQDDPILAGFIKDANEDVELKLVPYSTQLPLEAGTKVFKAAKRAALIYVRARWRERKKSFELAEKLDKNYETKITDLKKALEAEPTTRTKPVLHSLDYDTEDELFSQRTFT
ncbi:hypothetical protein LCGC14_2705030 [marine sediment metagenome]|uniref:Uncharacterized protein n=1 Tax=marine sediment metagenome TaxID=412755 RepID=A0A0F8ZEM4_9ZZZZ